MNVFALSRNPNLAAYMMCDKHVVKMIIETCQMLSCAMDYRGSNSKQYGLPQYPKAHAKHPCTIWTMESYGNYKWLVRHLEALCMEYRARYEKIHKLEGCCMVYEGQMDNLKFPKKERTEFVQAITNTKWHRKNPIEAYRTYYNMEKFAFAKWKLGNIPDWFTGPPKYSIKLEKNVDPI